MTTPSYAGRATGELAEVQRPSVDPPKGQVLAWRVRQWDRGVPSALRRPRLIQAGLDLAAIGFTALAFTTSALSAEFLFHCVFVVLVLHAFLFGLRGTLLRIGLASIPLLVYANAARFGISEPELELTEWPLMFVIAALVAWMAERRNSTSRRYARLYRRASERLLTVEEDERRRIARELHDGVGQVLTALTLTLDAAGASGDAASARSGVTSARTLADTALAGTRDLAHRMRPARLEERGLVPALRDLARQSGFPVVVDADAAAGAALDATETVELYRIVQEALANAARHSGAEQARVTFARNGDRLVIEVVDEGDGFDTKRLPESGIGLAGMVERARLIGGQISISSTPGMGTRVVVALPAGVRQAGG